MISKNFHEANHKTTTKLAWAWMFRLYWDCSVASRRLFSLIVPLDAPMEKGPLICTKQDINTIHSDHREVLYINNQTWWYYINLIRLILEWIQHPYNPSENGIYVILVSSHWCLLAGGVSKLLLHWNLSPHQWLLQCRSPCQLPLSETRNTKFWYYFNCNDTRQNINHKLDT